MTITVVNLGSGGQEPFDETLRHLIARNWTAANTNNKTPTCISPHGMGTTAYSLTTVKAPNAFKAVKRQNAITFKQKGTKDLPGESGSGIGFIAQVTRVEIIIFAQSPGLAFLFMEEANRIILENAPNSATRIKKSDNTNNSAIAKFNSKQIAFDEPYAIDSENDVVMAPGLIECTWYKQKS